MHGYSYWARVGNESPLARRHLREWAMLLDEWMRGTVARTRAAVARLTRHMAGVASDRGSWLASSSSSCCTSSSFSSNPVVWDAVGGRGPVASPSPGLSWDAWPAGWGMR